VFEYVYKVADDDPHPKSFGETMAKSDAQFYYDAAVAEIEALIANGTFEVVQLPPGKRAIGSRWVFLIKCKSDGSIDCYKARLVPKGYSQHPGFEFFDTFAPTIRAILALAAIEDMEIEAIDIGNAFLNGDIDADIYIEHPEGFPQGPAGTVLKLLKGLYGLKQSPQIWHKKLHSVLSGMGFVKVKCEVSIWVYQCDRVCIILPCFVDDMLLVSKLTAAVAKVKEELKAAFKLCDLGAASFFLGVLLEREHSKCQIHLSQCQYILDVLEQYGFTGIKPVTTPLNPSHCLTKARSPSTEEAQKMCFVPYAQVIGTLQTGGPLPSIQQDCLAFSPGHISYQPMEHSALSQSNPSVQQHCIQSLP
jgi:Reverse transcriptase (RNA-dependent DNA polymerase)